jgi:hypothetical protein
MLGLRLASVRTTASEVLGVQWTSETCSGTPSALGALRLLTGCLPDASSPTVFDCLAGIASNTDQPKELRQAFQLSD